MRAYELAQQNFAVAEHLLQLFEMFRNLREEEDDDSLRLAVCRVLSIPENTVLRHARNEKLVLAGKASMAIPHSLVTPDGLNFLLRQSVIVACTALESFYWDALRENVLTIVRARKRGADESLRKLTLTLDEYLSIQAFSDPDERLKEIILNNFERKTIYSPDSIDVIAKTLTVQNFWRKVAEKCGEPDTNLKRHIGELIKRRNCVAHRADRPDPRAEPAEETDGHGLRVISFAWVNLRVQTARNIVSASAEVFADTIRGLEQELTQATEQEIARQTLAPKS